jgi:hypothetical protein
MDCYYILIFKGEGDIECDFTHYFYFVILTLYFENEWIVSLRQILGFRKDKITIRTRLHYPPIFPSPSFYP